MLKITKVFGKTYIKSRGSKTKKYKNWNSASTLFILKIIHAVEAVYWYNSKTGWIETESKRTQPKQFYEEHLERKLAANKSKKED